MELKSGMRPTVILQQKLLDFSRNEIALKFGQLG